MTPNYRTLDEPTKLLGLSIGQWGAVALAAGFAYLLLLVSPLPWRVNVSLIVIFGGGPMVLLLLREQGALSAPAAGRRGLSLALRPRCSAGGPAEEPPGAASSCSTRPRPGSAATSSSRSCPGSSSRRDRERGDAGVELAEERRRVDDLARVLPLAAIEPDGLAITSGATYVRVIEADQVLQPWRGDVEHRQRLRGGCAS